MNTLDKIIDFIYVSIIGILSWFFGGVDGLVQVLIAVSILDYFTGVSAAYANKELSSSIGFKGIAKKIFVFTLVGFAHIIDRHMLGGTEGLKMAVCLFYIGNEGISILENANKMGVPFPKFLKERLLTFTKNDKEETKNKSGMA